jgi:hypothetical protein
MALIEAIDGGSSVKPASTNALFDAFGLGALTLPNRIVMAPMTRKFSQGGVPGADVADYFRRRAEAAAAPKPASGARLSQTLSGPSSAKAQYSKPFQ